MSSSAKHPSLRLDPASARQSPTKQKQKGAIVWKDRKKLNKLSAITRWPILKDAIAETIIQLFGNIPHSRLLIWDIPLLIERKFPFYYLCDEILVIYTSPEIQLERLIHREGLANANKRQQAPSSRSPEETEASGHKLKQ